MMISQHFIFLYYLNRTTQCKIIYHIQYQRKYQLKINTLEKTKLYGLDDNIIYDETTKSLKEEEMIFRHVMFQRIILQQIHYFVFDIFVENILFLSKLIIKLENSFLKNQMANHLKGVPLVKKEGKKYLTN